MLIRLLMLICFFALMVYVGFACRKHATDVDGFVLGSRSVGPWLTAFAYGTSYFSAVIFVGYAGQFGWRFGVASTWIGLGNAFLGSLLAWRVLGRRTRLMTRQLSSSTMPEFFARRFASPALRTGAAIIVFVFLIPYTASLYNGLSRLFGMAFHMDYTVCILLMAVLTGAYVILGGYMATAMNDFIQGIIMLFGIVAVIAAVLKTNGGFVGSLTALAQVEDTTTHIPGVFASFFGSDPIGLLSVVILTSLGTWGLPQMVGKFYAIKSEKAIDKGTIISTVFAIVVAGGCYFLGGFGRLFTTQDIVTASGYDSIIPSMLEKLPDLLIGVVMILVLSASMSTLSSLVLTSASTLTLDVLRGKVIKENDSKGQLLSIRLLIVAFIAVSAVLAIIQYKSAVTFIAQLMGISWGALAGAFLAPFLYGLYWKKTTKASVWCCFVSGVGIMVVNMVAKPVLPAFLQSPINCGAFAMLVGLLIVPIVSAFTRKPDSDIIDFAFACYEEKVLVSKKTALSENELGE